MKQQIQSCLVEKKQRDEERNEHFCVLRMSQLTRRVGLSRSGIYDKLDPKSPRHDSPFPRPISLGPRAVGFLESEIDSWIEARSAERAAA